MKTTVIIPSPLTSAFAADTKGSVSDSTELSQIFAASLTARGKHTPARTWLTRLKKGGWIQLLSSRTFSLSLGGTSLKSWLGGFSVSVGLVNRYPRQENEKPQKTNAEAYAKLAKKRTEVNQDSAAVTFGETQFV